LKRLLARHDEIPESLVHALFYPEAIFTLGALLHREGALIEGFKSFGDAATKHVERAASTGATIYHYRAGFGGKSVDAAKRLGVITLCDHSIAHPVVLESLVQNAGKHIASSEGMKITRFNEYILQDIERADAILVNSDFVKDTFIEIGSTRIPVHVIYWGVDDAFLDGVPDRTNQQGQSRILFAGFFQRRKGADTLVNALACLGNKPWQLEIAGSIEDGFRDIYPAFFADARVKFLGLLSRHELAKTMSQNEIFVFPSLAEGSARVVFEAMACGCYIITTPNSGSIVEDKVHGRLVPAGDHEALAVAIDEALSNPDRVADIGRRNAELIRENYRQSQYGGKLAALYSELLADRSVD
jgi:Glycosyltransferase